MLIPLPGGWDGLKRWDGVTNSTLLPKFRDRKEELTSLRFTFPRYFNTFYGSIIGAKYGSNDWIAIFLLLLLFYSCNLSHYRGPFNVGVLDGMRPPASACGPAHTSLRLFFLVVPAVDHWTGAELTHSNFLNLA